jgi:hypothetical protein
VSDTLWPKNKVQCWKGEWCGQQRMFIRCGYAARLRAQRIPGALWEGSIKAWHVPYSPAIVEAFMVEFPSTEFDIDYTEVVDLWSAAGAWRMAQQARVATDLPNLPIRGDGWLHQRRAFHFARSLRSAGLFVDMGGGKSLIAAGLFQEWGASNVLVLCPKSVRGVWPKELTKWSLSSWDYWVMPDGGTVVKKANALAGWLTVRRPAGRGRCVVVHYDSSWRPGMIEVLLQYVKQTGAVLVCDESHRIKSAGGKASRAAAKLGSVASRVLLLTGTPTPHGPQDIYGQYRAADPGIFGTNYGHFTGRFFRKRKINDKVEVIDQKRPFLDDEREAEFKRKMASIGIVIPREDMVPPNDGNGVDPSRRWTLPPVERQVALDAKTWKAYVGLRNELVAEIDKGLITADNALVKGLRLRQITSGHARVENPATGESRIELLGNEKRSLLAEVLEDLPGDKPVVVFGVFHPDLDAIRYVADEMGRPYLELSGRRRDGLTESSELAAFSNEIVGVQLQSGGVGVDFTRCHQFVYYSIDYNLGNVLQARDRGDRPGQTQPITEIHLVAVSPLGGQTVDGVTYNALSERKALNTAVMDALRHREL